jgi:hypothetical protein
MNPIKIEKKIEHLKKLISTMMITIDKITLVIYRMKIKNKKE